MDEATRGRLDAEVAESRGDVLDGESLNDFDAAREHSADVIAEEPDLSTTPHSLADAEDDDSTYAGASADEIEPSLVDQELLNDPMAASGPSSSADDAVSDGDEVYVPPTDPVVAPDDRGGVEMLGGFSETAIDGVAPLPSASDGRLGDEAIEDAVRAALRRDSATTDLRINVLVRGGVAHLRGQVADLDDAENAEDVASRVPGVREVVEELTVADV